MLSIACAHAQVPADYEHIWLGALLRSTEPGTPPRALPQGVEGPPLVVSPVKAPWCTHARIISRTGAVRLLEISERLTFAGEFETSGHARVNDCPLSELNSSLKCQCVVSTCTPIANDKVTRIHDVMTVHVSRVSPL